MDSTDCVVVGAGVVGLAIARELAIAGYETVILEQHATIGTETSSRNSEVIHAGIYYPKDSLKARLCVRGRELLYAYCDRQGLPHRRCTKLIVATDDAQLAELTRLAAAARGNGVDDLQLLDRAQAKALEPALRCVAALLSPSTGIIDSHAYMLALLGDAERHGATFVGRSRVAALTARAAGPNGVDIRIGDEAQAALRSHWLINAAGLDAPALARRIDGFPDRHVPRTWYAKGNYFGLTGPAPFRRLVYPVPEPGGLGVHMTLDLSGRARFGPDVEWIDVPDYAVDPRRVDGFHDAIRRYYPALRDGTLVPDYAGIRPKLSPPGAPPADFRIDGPGTHGVPGIVNLFGIESPGLTASLAIAEAVGEIVRTG